MPLHLAIDSSTSRPAVALLEGERVLHDWLGPEGVKHHETLLRGVDECLKSTGFQPSDLNFLSVGVGPGMFTGLRIGITTAKFLADPLGLACVPVSSLVALATQSPLFDQARTWAISDAKSQRVYALCLEPGSLAADFSPPADEELALAPALAAEKMRAGDSLIGEGACLYREAWPAGTQLATSGLHELRASAIGRIGARRYALGLTVSATALEPKYLKTGQDFL